MTAHAHVQRLVSVVKMVTVLEDVLPKNTVLLCISCVQKDSMQRIFIKKYFLFTVGSVWRVKRFITGWQTFRRWRRSWNGGAKVVETTVKRLLSCGFRRTGKAMGQVYQCLWWTCREINVPPPPGSNIHMLYVLYPFVTYLLILPHIFMNHATVWMSKSIFKHGS
jgi:hypothetical protein